MEKMIKNRLMLISHVLFGLCLICVVSVYSKVEIKKIENKYVDNYNKLNKHKIAEK